MRDGCTGKENTSAPRDASLFSAATYCVFGRAVDGERNRLHRDEAMLRFACHRVPQSFLDRDAVQRTCCRCGLLIRRMRPATALFLLVSFDSSSSRLQVMSVVPFEPHAYGMFVAFVLYISARAFTLNKSHEINACSETIA